VLELQAACGFRAFASLRLGANAPEGRRLGLDARESGRVLHKAMELLWKELGTQAALKNLPADQRRAVVQRNVEQAFGRVRRRITEQDAWTKAYLGVLEQRLTTLLLRWLENELERGGFSVLPPEQEQTVPVGPLELTVRPDRIDKVEGGFVFVDYKTSFDLSTDDWLGERPNAPQLPLYALLAEPDEVRGLAFARVRPGKDMAWLSLEDQPGLFPPKRGDALHDLAQELENWRLELDRLASDFAAGRAEIDPKQYPHACKYCEQRLLCRLDAAALLAGAQQEPEPEDQIG
jgi:ATP-dependent helicase/DNAse subunit B